MVKGSSPSAALAAILLSVALNAAGQLLFKAARYSQPDASLVALFFQPSTWAGLLLYGLSAVCWLWVLSRAPLSYAYPILSLTFPLVVGLSIVLFLESVTPLHWLGIGVIMVGVALLART